MAPIVVGIDLGQSPFRLGGLVIGKYNVVQGDKDVKVNGTLPPDRHQVVEVFRDANQVVKSYFGSSNIQAAVVVVPNSTTFKNCEAVGNAASGANLNIVQVIKEHTAVAAAYADKVKSSPTKRRIAIVSVTGDVLDVSIILIISDLEFELVAHETHAGPFEFDESKHSGPVGLFGHASGLIGGGEVKALAEDPLDKFLCAILEPLMSRPKLGPVDDVVFVGKASKSEKLKHAAKVRFSSAPVWSAEEVVDVDLAALGATVIACKGKSANIISVLGVGEESVVDDDKNISPQVEDILLGEHCESK